MPIDLLPETRPPIVVILTEAGGLATEEVEQLVTHPLEMVLNGMPDVERVRSTTDTSTTPVLFEMFGERRCGACSQRAYETF
jgi:HME family heavy-metal exporter